MLSYVYHIGMLHSMLCVFLLFVFWLGWFLMGFQDVVFLPSLAGSWTTFLTNYACNRPKDHACFND